MLQQYFRAKAEHPEALVAMRVGDFYEFYGPDAEQAAAALEITLTGRDDGGERIPMAGVPFHAFEKYLSRLLRLGLRVAVCDQLEDPKATKGLIKRGVTRVLTPGTVLEDSMLSSGQNNYLVAICVQDGRAGLAILDSSTGEFAVTELVGESIQEKLVQELARLRPTELILNPEADGYGEMATQALGSAVSEAIPMKLDRATKRLLDQFRVSNLQGFGCEDKPSAIVAASMILGYADKNRVPLDHLEGISTYSVDGFMRLDPSTRRSLELTQSLTDGSKKYTLLSVLDQTVTSMGARLLRRWIEQPLLDPAMLAMRHNAVEQFSSHAIFRGDLRDGLKKVADLERLVARVATGLAGPRDLAALRNTLFALPLLEEPLRRLSLGRIQELRAQMIDHSEIATLLDRAIVADPPHHLREGGVIRENYDLELDKLRTLGRDGKSYIAGLETEERERTGIGNLKVGFNSVFGYFLEVSKLHLDKVPADYIRKQTTANAERYITAALKEHESLVLGAEEKATALETDLFQRIRLRVAEHSRSLLQTARALAEIDVLAGLAEVAAVRGYIKPEIVESDSIEILSGRHPVVETANRAFVPNDLVLETEPRLLILTGPNMAGKSTYLRQIALIILMAQVGSYVPAKKCRFGICDRIFARIGAKDELALGQSTFMVEMVESANILNHATPQSLVILDEVGRGTSTFDGLAIAWAMIEHLARIGAKTLFATHYHQLNSLAAHSPEIANFRVAVEEIGDEIVWTHRVVPGGADRSYGIHVARMAGVPPEVLYRATEILSDLESSDAAPRQIPTKTEKLQLTLFEIEEAPMVQELRALDVNRLSPLDALRLLDEWKRKHAQG